MSLFKGNNRWGKICKGCTNPDHPNRILLPQESNNMLDMYSHIHNSLCSFHIKWIKLTLSSSEGRNN
ncbi:unnamed protein product [Pocillopora meandrina]|uniref:Uncharacterized protein n=1 Tax=Pocillopora meandrina TaxID=46732 RepID=A0AAU9X0Q5_9CNID|nr:unnamed protein product [Pocillopora meandrina]